MTTLIFPAVVTGSAEAGYAGQFPDVAAEPFAAATVAELLVNGRSVLQRHLQALSDRDEEWPTPTSLEAAAQAHPGAMLFLVDVSVEDTPVRVNISIGERLLGRIDQAAELQGVSRSGFIASAARAALGERRGKATAPEMEQVLARVQEEVAVLSRRVAEAVGPNSAFNRTVVDLDARLADAIKKTAENVSAAMARRQQSRTSEPPAEEARP